MFFPATTIEWNNLDQELRSCKSFSLFYCYILKLLDHLQIAFSIIKNQRYKICYQATPRSSHLWEHKLKPIDPQIPKLTFRNLTNTLLSGNLSFSNKINTTILDATVKYILSTI